MDERKVGTVAGKSRMFHVRVTEEQWEHVMERAAAIGCSAGSYVRHAVAAYALASDEAGGEPPAFVGVDAASVREISREFIMQGINLNQATHALNTAALAEERADSGLSDDDRRVLLEGVEDARLALSEISKGLVALDDSFRKVLKRRLVEIPPPMKKVERARRKAALADAGEGV